MGLSSNSLQELRRFAPYRLGSGGDPEGDGSREVKPTDRSKAAHEDLPYKVELWDVDKKSVGTGSGGHRKWQHRICSLLRGGERIPGSLRYAEAQERNCCAVEWAGPVTSLTLAAFGTITWHGLTLRPRLREDLPYVIELWHAERRDDVELLLARARTRSLHEPSSRPQ